MNISVACITESWLTESENHTTFRIKSYGYLISHKHRNSSRGGGVCFIYKPSLRIKMSLNIIRNISLLSIIVLLYHLQTLQVNSRLQAFIENKK